MGLSCRFVVEEFDRCLFFLGVSFEFLACFWRRKNAACADAAVTAIAMRGAFFDMLLF